MSRITVSSRRQRIVISRRYGFWAFIFDCFMFCITSGLWLIWIFVREMRKR